MEALSAAAARLAPAGATAPPVRHAAQACSPRLALAIVQLVAEPALLLDGGRLCEAHLRARLAASALLPPASLATSALLHPPRAPAGLLRRLRAGAPWAAAEEEAEAREFGAQLLELALSTHQLPPPGGEAAAAAVLVYSAEGGAAGGGGSSNSSGAGGPPGGPGVWALQVKEDALAVFVAGAAPAATGEAAQQEGVLRQVAALTAAWLEDGARQAAAAAPDSASGRSGAGQLAGACLADAGARLGELAAALGALPGMPVSAELAVLVGRAMRAAEAAQQQQQQLQEGQPKQLPVNAAEAEALRLAREAWGAAATAAQHPGFGLEPVFPAEHQLAIVLPLTLPLALVVLRAAGREVKEWRAARRGAKAAAAAAGAGRGKKED